MEPHPDSWDGEDMIGDPLPEDHAIIQSIFERSAALSCKQKQKNKKK